MRGNTTSIYHHRRNRPLLQTYSINIHDAVNASFFNALVIEHAPCPLQLILDLGKYEVQDSAFAKGHVLVDVPDFGMIQLDPVNRFFGVVRV